MAKITGHIKYQSAYVYPPFTYCYNFIDYSDLVGYLNGLIKFNYYSNITIIFSNETLNYFLNKEL